MTPRPVICTSSRILGQYSIVFTTITAKTTATLANQSSDDPKAHVYTYPQPNSWGVLYCFPQSTRQQPRQASSTTTHPMTPRPMYIHTSSRFLGSPRSPWVGAASSARSASWWTVCSRSAPWPSSRQPRPPRHRRLPEDPCTAAHTTTTPRKKIAT